MMEISKDDGGEIRMRVTRDNRKGGWSSDLAHGEPPNSLVDNGELFRCHDASTTRSDSSGLRLDPMNTTSVREQSLQQGC